MCVKFSFLLKGDFVYAGIDIYDAKHFEMTNCFVSTQFAIVQVSPLCGFLCNTLMLFFSFVFVFERSHGVAKMCCYRIALSRMALLLSPANEVQRRQTGGLVNLVEGYLFLFVFL
jgi:hypothetical protein